MDKIKLAYIGDSPFINSGFGVVARSILSRLPGDIEIHALGTMCEILPSDISPLKSYRPVCSHDMMGFGAQASFVVDTGPDVLFLIGDPGTLRSRYEGLFSAVRFGALCPVVSYFPLEGAPLNDHIVMQARMVAGPVTYTEWGVEELKKHGVEDVDYIYHGFDHGPFCQYIPEDADDIRQKVGWDRKFVVGNVGVNKRTNRQPSIIEAARILKDRGRDDIVFYLHCQEKGDVFMAGWELGWMLRYYDVEDMVVLKPNQNEHKYMARPLETFVNLDRPEDNDHARRNLSQLGLVALLNCFDVYLDPASAHGFNLPAGEAAKCGVPVVTVNDRFARSEIFGGCAHMMEPTGWDHWHTGAQLPLVSPRRIADSIEMLADDAELRLEVARKCKSRFDDLSWDSAASLFETKIRAAAEFGRELGLR